MSRNNTVSPPRDYPRPLSLVAERNYLDEKAPQLPHSEPVIVPEPDFREHDERGFKVLKGGDRFDVTVNPLTDDSSNDDGRMRANRVDYLEGLRGIVGLQTLLWIFFRLFAPAMVTDMNVEGERPAAFVEGAGVYNVLRKVLSPLLFNGSLQVTMLIILSGRVSLLTFIERRQAVALAGPAFRRPFRLAIPAAIALMLTSVVSLTGGFNYATYMADTLKNDIAYPPKIWDSALEYFNSLVTYFFAPITYKDSRAVSFIPPSGIMWFITVVFQQTYVLIIYAWTFPYTIFKYKSWGLPLLILITGWVGRWSWYTLTGLAIAEYSVVYRQLLPARGIPLNRRGTKFMQAWLVPAALTLLGVFFKYIWIAAVPDMQDAELVAHANANTGRLNYGINSAKLAFPRYDDWLVCTGVLILIELSSGLRSFLSWKPFVHLGRLGFSIALTSGTVMLSLGSLVFYHLSHTLGWTNVHAITGVLFVIFVPLCLVCAEIFSVFVDDFSLALSQVAFRFARE